MTWVVNHPSMDIEKTEDASSNETSCFLMLRAAFFPSQAKSIIASYIDIINIKSI